MEESEIELQQAEKFTPLEATQNFALEAAVAAAAVGEQNFTTVQARITKSSPSAAWKTLVLGTLNLFHNFEGGHFKRGC